ncbi:glycoside hydrolase superfamily [Crassisporium funariophilum]|nr:glycoside hydrolase superfamily [Crassisporium funariophilum]
MKRLYEKLQSRSNDIQKPLFSEHNISQDHFRYRQQRGVNLGSWFVLERWITDEPFRCASAPGQSDLDIAHGSNAKDILEKHWDTWIQETDWEWIAQRGINTVRIPIGYYHVCGAEPSVLHGTDFQPFHDVYCGAWSRITRAIDIASRYGLGVLIDLHAAPGKQNNDTHAGTSDKANFFGDPHNQRVTIRVLEALLDNLQAFTECHNPPLYNVVGIELLNEPSPPSDDALRDWYASAIKHLRSKDRTLPIYMGECWRTETYADFVTHHSSSTALTVLDHHLYRCFTSSDINTSAEDHTRALQDPSASFPRMLAAVSEKLGRAGGGIIVGEWSGALNPGSFRGTPDEQKNWVKAQLDLFERCCGGWFFWTYKKQHGGDTGWSFRDAVERGVFPNFVGTKMREIGRDEVSSMLILYLGKHVQYWSQIPGHYDHARFGEGFIIGWDDAYEFILASPPSSATISQLGFKGAWAMRRTSDHGKAYWEFEHGFMQGVDAAKGDFRQ